MDSPEPSQLGDDDTVPTCDNCGGALVDGSCVTEDCRPKPSAEQQAALDSQTGVDGGMILRQLYENRVIDGMVERVIIDIKVGEPIKLYVQKYASVQFMDVMMGPPIIAAILKGKTVEIEAGHNATDGD